MSARGFASSASEGRSIQAPGMMRHGPVPTLGSAGWHPIEQLPPPELLENKLAVQGAEMDRLARENHRLAASHGTLRHELLAAQQEMQRLQVHAGRVQTESDIQIRSLVDKISKMEAEIKAGESVKKELQQAHMEAQGLVAARMDLTAQIQQATEELQKTHSDIKLLPEMRSELDGLMQEHQKLRATFEREKGSNMELVQHMHAMERNLITMAGDVEKLRAEVQNAEKRAHAPAPNTYQNAYGSGNPAHPSSGQGAVYADGGYGQAGTYGGGAYSHGGGVYASGSYGQGVPGSYADPYGRTQVQMTGSATGEGGNPYGAMNAATYNSARGATAGAYDSQKGAVAGATTGAYDAARLAAAAAGGGGAYDATRVATAGGGAYDAARVTAAAAAAYDSQRSAAAMPHDAARGAAAGGGTPGAYDAARAGEGAAGLYDPARAGSNVYGMYDAARAGKQSMQR